MWFSTDLSTGQKSIKWGEVPKKTPRRIWRPFIFKELIARLPILISSQLIGHLEITEWWHIKRAGAPPDKEI
jgi:hypothetical protein